MQSDGTPTSAVALATQDHPKSVARAVRLAFPRLDIDHAAAVAAECGGRDVTVGDVGLFTEVELVTEDMQPLEQELIFRLGVAPLCVQVWPMR